MHKATELHPIEIGALVALVNQDRLSEAEHKARALLAMHPNAGILWKILSVAQVRQGKDALQALRRAAELMPQDGEAHCNLGAALHDQGQWSEALVCLRRALALQPDNAAAMVDAADALRALNRPREAVPLYQQALRRDARLIEAHNNLGNALLDLGQYAAAADCYRLALGLKPDDPKILCNLAGVARQLGLFDEAVASYGQALILNPGSVDALNSLGDVLRDLGRRREAAALYRRAIELDSQRAQSHCNLGTVLFEFRQIDEALACYRRALALRPDYALAHVSLGSALRQQRRPADAEASARAALAIDPNYVEALSLLGELLADRGQFSEAEEIFRRAIAINAEFSFAYASIATHRKMTRDDAAWLKGAEALIAKRLPLGQEISLRYALGKYFDDVGQYDQAFEQYRQANELTKRFGAVYDRAKLTQLVDRLIGSFDAGLFQRTRAHASDSELPVFIVGMPRSGTSLAEQILASHPAVFGAGEVVFWSNAYAGCREAQLAGTMDADLMAGMARDYLASMAPLAAGAQRVVDKMPANFLYAGLIHCALPQARIIHMQRHPIDTCLSIYFQNFFNIGPYANDLGDLTHFYREYLRITSHWRAALPPTALLEVPYEALIEDQEGWTRRMLEFVGLPWDPICLDFHQTDRVVITASKWQVRQKISKASIARWRHYERFVGPLRSLVDP